MPLKHTRKEVKVKAWVVVWPGYANGFITNAHHNSSEAIAVFSTYYRAKRFADSYTNGRIMKTIPCTITYSLPKQKKGKK